MSKVSDFLKYRDKFGLSQLYPGDPAPITDNGAIMSLEYFLCLSPEEQRMDILRIKSALRSLEIKTDNGLVSCRYPGNRLTDLMSNAIALIVFSELFDDSRFSKELYKHGELTRAKNLDSYQDQEKTFKYYPIAWLLSGLKAPNRFYNIRQYDWSIQSWWAKSPSFVALLKLSAIDRVSWLEILSLWIGLFIPLFQSKTLVEDKRVAYTVWQWLKKRNRIWNLSYKLWCFLLTRIYPEGMVEVYRIYHGPDHPIVKYSQRYLK